MSGFEQPVSAGVAKRLAAAADGFRHGRPMYFVSGFREPGVVLRFEGEGGREAAERARRSREAEGGGEEFGVFGPYVTAPGRGPAAPPAAEVLDVTVRMKLPDGSTRTQVLGGGEYDAIFWTRSAVDKFVVPYYVGALGLQYATRVSEDFSGRDVYLLAHMPDTMPAMIRVADAGG
ncbi:MAG TPA: hypothetical protein VFQ76_04540, partial [Longimicrobiaceae bacterium]|nr:hypothetical protein [Longimicrobiaceae bacterium]